MAKICDVRCPSCSRDVPAIVELRGGKPSPKPDQSCRRCHGSLDAARISPGATVREFEAPPQPDTATAKAAAPAPQRVSPERVPAVCAHPGCGKPNGHMGRCKNRSYASDVNRKPKSPSPGRAVVLTDSLSDAEKTLRAMVEHLEAEFQAITEKCETLVKTRLAFGEKLERAKAALEAITDINNAVVPRGTPLVEGSAE